MERVGRLARRMGREQKTRGGGRAEGKKETLGGRPRDPEERPLDIFTVELIQSVTACQFPSPPFPSPLLSIFFACLNLRAAKKRKRQSHVRKTLRTYPMETLHTQAN